MINIINSSLLQYLKNTKEYSHTCISSSCRIRGLLYLLYLLYRTFPSRVQVCRCAGVVLGRTYVQVNEDYLKGLHTTGLQAQSGGGGEVPLVPLVPLAWSPSPGVRSLARSSALSGGEGEERVKASVREFAGVGCTLRPYAQSSVAPSCPTCAGLRKFRCWPRCTALACPCTCGTVTIRSGTSGMRCF